MRPCTTTGRAGRSWFSPPSRAPAAVFNGNDIRARAHPAHGAGIRDAAAVRPGGEQRGDLSGGGRGTEAGVARLSQRAGLPIERAGALPHRPALRWLPARAVDV